MTNLPDRLATVTLLPGIERKGNDIMTLNPKMKAPTTFWIVAILSLLWNAFGAYDYVQTQLANREYLDGMTQGMALTVDELIAYYDAFPAWMDAAWALGVWGSVAGSILLLLRTRFALHAFLVSLLGLVVTTAYTIAVPVPGMTNLIVPIVFTVVIFAVLLALIWYTRRMIARHVLT